MASTSNTCVQCSCIVCTEVRRNLNEIYRVLDIYGWLLDSYIVVRIYVSYLQLVFCSNN